jgi:hypothetical protein
MKKLICSLIGLVMLSGVSSAIGVWGVEGNRAVKGNYDLKFPVVFTEVYRLPVLEDRYYVKLEPIFTSANENLTNLGFQQSRYDLVLGSMWNALDGKIGVEAGLCYYAPQNRE